MSDFESREEQWIAVDRYLADMLVPSDPALDAALQASTAGGLPAHNVAPNQGKLLQLLALLQGARRILEIGTLGGYSTIWLARGLAEGGKLTTIEVNPQHAEVARANIDRAGLAHQIDLRLGPALEILPQLQVEGAGPFDLIFIDANKPNNPEYLSWALQLSRPGSLILVDNVIRDGAVIDESSVDPSVQGVRRMNEMIAADGRLDATAIQTVGSKGYDGFALIRVKTEP